MQNSLSRRNPDQGGRILREGLDCEQEYILR